MKFTELITLKLNTFLTKFQIEQPMVPFLSNILKNILSSMLRKFILGGTIEKADTTIKLLQLNTSNKNIHKPNGLIDIGVAEKQPSFTSSSRVFVRFCLLNKSYDWEVSVETPYYLMSIYLEPKLFCCNIPLMNHPKQSSAIESLVQWKQLS